MSKLYKGRYLSGSQFKNNERICKKCHRSSPYKICPGCKVDTEYFEAVESAKQSKWFGQALKAAGML